MIIAGNNLGCHPTWKLDKQEKFNNIDIFGMLCGAINNKYADKRAQTCRYLFYTLRGIDMYTLVLHLT